MFRLQFQVGMDTKVMFCSSFFCEHRQLFAMTSRGMAFINVIHSKILVTTHLSGAKE